LTCSWSWLRRKCEPSDFCELVGNIFTGTCEPKGHDDDAGSGVAENNQWWQTVTGPCEAGVVNGTDGCVSSPNFPAEYTNDHECHIELAASSVRLYVASFETEASAWPADILYVNGAPYSGFYPFAEHTIDVTTTISWTSDYSVVKPGWLLCSESVISS
jgi:hypothetical protein